MKSLMLRGMNVVNVIVNVTMTVHVLLRLKINSSVIL